MVLVRSLFCTHTVAAPVQLPGNAVALPVQLLCWCIRYGAGPLLSPQSLDVYQWRPSISSCFLIDSQYVVAMHALPCVLLAFKHCIAD